MNQPDLQSPPREAQVRAPDEAQWRRFAAAASGEEFCAAWLALQCARVGGVASAVVVLQRAEGSPYVPAAQLPEGRRPHPSVAAAVERALRDGVGVVERRPSADGSAQPLAVAFPVRVDARVRAAVGMELAPRTEAQLQQAMRQIQWGSGWVEALLRRASTLQETSGRDRLARALEVLATALQKPDIQSAAVACTTELAGVLRADRVSLGLLRGRRVRLEALSHTAEMDRHANLVRAIEAAMDEAVDQDLTVLVPRANDKRPMLTGAHEQLLRESGADLALTVVLRHGERVLGALSVERRGGTSIEPVLVEFCESVAALLGPVLDLQEQAAAGALRRIRRAAFGQWQRLVGPGHAGFKLTMGICAAAIAFLVFTDGMFRVTAQSVVEGQVQRAVTAPFGGYVRDASARAGDLVRQGEVLARLDDRDLRLEHLKAVSQRNQIANQFREAMAGHDRAQSRILGAQMQQIEAHISLLEEQLSRTALVAPIDGIVISGDLSQKLGAPVERGEVLFEVAPPERYRLVLQVDEHDIDHVAAGQQGQLALTALPRDRFEFTVVRITPVTVAREGRNAYRVEATFDSDSARLRPGMEGVAKVEAGERRLGWIWTRAFADWLRLKLWSLAP